jgi:hypothetical protein
MNGANSHFWKKKIQCHHDIAYEISYKTFFMEFMVFVGCAYGGQYYLNKNEKYTRKIWKSEILKFSSFSYIRFKVCSGQINDARQYSS